MLSSKEPKLKGNCVKRTADVAVAVVGQRISNGGHSQVGRANTDTENEPPSDLGQKQNSTNTKGISRSFVATDKLVTVTKAALGETKDNSNNATTISDKPLGGGHPSHGSCCGAPPCGHPHPPAHPPPSYACHHPLPSYACHHPLPSYAHHPLPPYAYHHPLPPHAHHPPPPYAYHPLPPHAHQPPPNYAYHHPPPHGHHPPPPHARHPCGCPPPASATADPATVGNPGVATNSSSNNSKEKNDDDNAKSQKTDAPATGATNSVLVAKSPAVANVAKPAATTQFENASNASKLAVANQSKHSANAATSPPSNEPPVVDVNAPPNWNSKRSSVANPYLKSYTATGTNAGAATGTNATATNGDNAGAATGTNATAANGVKSVTGKRANSATNVSNSNAQKKAKSAGAKTANSATRKRTNAGAATGTNAGATDGAKIAAKTKVKSAAKNKAKSATAKKAKSSTRKRDNDTSRKRANLNAKRSQSGSAVIFPDSVASNKNVEPEPAASLTPRPLPPCDADNKADFYSIWKTMDQVLEDLSFVEAPDESTEKAWLFDNYKESIPVIHDNADLIYAEKCIVCRKEHPFGCCNTLLESDMLRCNYIEFCNYLVDKGEVI